MDREEKGQGRAGGGKYPESQRQRTDEKIARHTTISTLTAAPTIASDTRPRAAHARPLPYIAVAVSVQNLRMKHHYQRGMN